MGLAWAVVALAIAGAALWGLVRQERPSPGATVALTIKLAPEPKPPAEPPKTEAPPATAALASVPSPPVAPPSPPTPPAEAAATSPPAPGPVAAVAPPALPTPPPVRPAALPAPATVPPIPPGPAPWIRFARPFDPDDRRPRIAVVMTDLGLSNAATDAAIQQLPGGVSLAFSPHTDALDHWIALARAAGHEALLALPMEPLNAQAEDPGPRALLTTLTPQQNMERLDWVLGRVSGYVGIINYKGSRFTASSESLRPVLAAINQRGLMFVDSRASPRSVAPRIASELGLPRAIGDRVIDQEASRAAIDGNLAEIERTARQAGAAVALAQPYPVTFERLALWLPTLDGKGLVLAPVTAVVNRQADR
ncbi:MAG: divergent polysaccharide deacetylase family protein [Proteobacteria bacterium]|nr:divergent polysaccharide deacetylase family protein [Pseudomonadota bacterium]